MALPGQEETRPLPRSPENQQMDQQGPAQRAAHSPRPHGPAVSSVAKIPWDIVNQGQEPPVGRAQATTPKGQPATARGRTWHPMTPNNPSQGADKLLPGWTSFNPHNCGGGGGEGFLQP